MPVAFTPLASFAGGLLIGSAAVLLMLLHGRILGATGILRQAILPASKANFVQAGSLLIGMATAPFVYGIVSGEEPVITVNASPLLLVTGGILVGVGVTLSNGCTSGHGVCGIARLSKRSLVATACFMSSALLTVFVIRHGLGISQ